MRKQSEVRYIVTATVSIPVMRLSSKTEAYKQATKPGWGVVDWEGTGKEKALVCDGDCNADIYTKDGGYFGISPYEEVNTKEMPKQADVEAIIIRNSDADIFWTKGQIRVFVTYDENGLIGTWRIVYGADAMPYGGETELTFEDLYKSEGPEWDESYRAEIPGTIEYQSKQESASSAQAVEIREDDQGVTHCGNCGAELLCNKCGDMPDTCQHCGRKLAYSIYTTREAGTAAEDSGTDSAEKHESSTQAAESHRPAWMNDWQYEAFQEACNLIDTIKTAKDFFRVIDILNTRFSLDVINAARERKKCYNSGQYERPQEWAEISVPEPAERDKARQPGGP